MILSVRELIDIAVMSAFVGFIFKDVFRPVQIPNYDPLRAAGSMFRGIEFSNFWFAMAVTAPAIILHEMAHKFVAIAFGAQATFYAAYTWLGLGLLLKLMNFGFIFFVPGYVAHTAIAPLANMLVAGAGPFTNLAFWGIAKAVLRSKARLSPVARQAFALTARINLFLFFFNMLPIPPFDGFQFFSGLVKFLF